MVKANIKGIRSTKPKTILEFPSLNPNFMRCQGRKIKAKQTLHFFKIAFLDLINTALIRVITAANRAIIKRMGHNVKEKNPKRRSSLSFSGLNSMALILGRTSSCLLEFIWSSFIIHQSSFYFYYLFPYLGFSNR